MGEPDDARRDEASADDDAGGGGEAPQRRLSPTESDYSNAINLSVVEEDVFTEVCDEFPEIADYLHKLARQRQTWLKHLDISRAYRGVDAKVVHPDYVDPEDALTPLFQLLSIELGPTHRLGRRAAAPKRGPGRPGRASRAPSRRRRSGRRSRTRRRRSASARRARRRVATARLRRRTVVSERMARIVYDIYVGPL